MVAAKAQALGLHVIAHSPRLTPAEAHEAGCRAVDLPELLQTADFVSLHLPLNPQTMHMFDRGQFDLMKPGAIFINTSRGGLVDSAALAGALASGTGCRCRYRRAAPKSRRDADNSLLSQENLIITPHVAFYSEESLAALQSRTAHAVARVLQAHMPESVVNPEVLERVVLR